MSEKPGSKPRSYWVREDTLLGVYYRTPDGWWTQDFTLAEMKTQAEAEAVAKRLKRQGHNVRVVS